MPTYAGVGLAVATPELRDWIAANIPLEDCCPFRFTPSRNLQTLSWPGPPYRERKVQLGRLWWPTGASRWAIGHFLATESQLHEIRKVVYAQVGNPPYSMTYTAADLVLADGTGSITAPLWMLPPRPLAQNSTATNWTLPATIADAGEPLYLLTLVDDRYFWWDRAASIDVDEGTTTWTQLFAAIATGLGVSITIESVAAAYLYPPAELGAKYQALPLLLDAAAAAVGQRVVRKLDGSVITQGAEAAKTSLDAQLAATAGRHAGGLLALEAGDVPTPLVPITDLPGLTPASVTVAFPRTTNGVLVASEHVVPVTLSSLALDAFDRAVTHAGTQMVQSSAIAAYAGGASPTNDAELTTLAQRIARDWYLWRLAKAECAFAGVAAWTPEGLSDAVEWVHDATADRVQALVRPASWREWVERLPHAGSEGAALHFFTDVQAVNLTYTHVLQIEAATPTSGRYDCTVQTYLGNGTWSDSTPCWGRDLNNDTGHLTVGHRYAGVYLGVENGRPIYGFDGDEILDSIRALSAPAADRLLFFDFSTGEMDWLQVDGTYLVITGTTISWAGMGVAEVDGSPALTGIKTIRFDQADGFTVTDLGGGVARIDLTPVISGSATVVTNVVCTGGALRVYKRPLTVVNGVLTLGAETFSVAGCCYCPPVPPDEEPEWYCLTPPDPDPPWPPDPWPPGDPPGGTCGCSESGPPDVTAYTFYVDLEIGNGVCDECVGITGPVELDWDGDVINGPCQWTATEYVATPFALCSPTDGSSEGGITLVAASDGWYLIYSLTVFPASGESYTHIFAVYFYEGTRDCTQDAVFDLIHDSGFCAMPSTVTVSLL